MFVRVLLTHSQKNSSASDSLCGGRGYRQIGVQDRGGGNPLVMSRFADVVRLRHYSGGIAWVYSCHICKRNSRE